MSRGSEVDVLLVFGWHDGPLEGVLRYRGEPACWYFKMLAQRLETSLPDDRLFGLQKLPAQDSTVLAQELGSADRPYIWPVTGGIGSVRARQIVDDLLARPRQPTVIIQTTDLAKVTGIWNVVTDYALDHNR